MCRKQTPFPSNLPSCYMWGAGEMLDGPGPLNTQRPQLDIFTNPEVSALGREWQKKEACRLCCTERHAGPHLPQDCCRGPYA